MSPSLTVLSVVRAILKDPKDQTEVWLLFANQTEDDILLRSELEEIANDPVNGKRFHLWYTLDRPPEGWKYSSGFINKDMCAAHLPPPADDTMLFVCGPPPSECLSCHVISYHVMSYNETIEAMHAHTQPFINSMRASLNTDDKMRPFVRSI
jgi:Na+-transporting NADH:ubiquinone oxidoreductase subunit NqrF